MLIGHSMTDRVRIGEVLRNKGSVFYFIGIGGISVSSLALYMKCRGAAVAGSDKEENDKVKELRSRGINVFIGSKKSHILRIMPTIVVYSLSISSNDLEYLEAKRLGILCVSRAELLGAIMEEYKTSVGTCASHGKSTVTAMVYSILRACGSEPTLFLGAQGKDIPSFSEGDGKTLVYEACEYYDSFLHFSPTVGIFLNIELDHTDYFKDIRQYKASFVRAANLSREIAILNADDENIRSVLGEISVPKLTYSASDGYDYKYVTRGFYSGKSHFDLYKGSELVGHFELPLPGRHNVTDAVAAVICALYLGMDMFAVGKALGSFSGLFRRLERIGSIGDCDVYYDYAHHPSEIIASKNALCDLGYKKICAVFAPHTYSRTAAFMNEFAVALSGFELSLITDITGAREDPIIGVSSSSLARSVRELGGESHAVSSEEALSLIKFEKYDCIALLGAGDLDIIKKKLEDT